MPENDIHEVKIGEFLISTDEARMDLDVVHRYLTYTSYWAEGINRARLERAVNHSLCTGVYQNDLQIGFGRVVTDHATFAYFCDIFLIDEHQRKGIGTQLMKFLHDLPELDGIRRWHLSTKDAHAFYEKHGWTRTDGDGHWMQIVRPYDRTRPSKPPRE